MWKYFSTLFVCLTFACNAQEFDNLIFEGGGIRGIAYTEAIKVLEGRNALRSVERVGGTSAGAIAAQKKTKGYYDIMVDRGLTGNYPIAIFDKRASSNDSSKDRRKTLGLRIDSPGKLESIRFAPIVCQSV